MNTTELKSLAASLKLTKNQREILVGLILGDGHLETQNRGRTFRLKIEHSISQKNYVNWLYEHFKQWILTPPQIKIQTVAGIKREKYWFSTLSAGSLRFYGLLFYKN